MTGAGANGYARHAASEGQTGRRRARNGIRGALPEGAPALHVSPGDRAATGGLPDTRGGMDHATATPGERIHDPKDPSLKLPVPAVR